MYQYDTTSPDRTDRDYDDLADWEQQVANAVGRVIEFWGFKRNHGRVWAVLYLRDQALTSADIQKELELSKGAVSMITRDLVDWNIVDTTYESGSQARHFVAGSDFLEMIRRVVRERELRLVREVEEDLEAALEQAKEADASDQTVERIDRMRRLADMVRNGIEVFLSSARIDINDAKNIL